MINPDLERQDDQFDVKIDHALSDANRFFVRYSFQKSHRFLPPSLPRGDGGVAGDSDITAQSVAFNDTHSFGPRWLNELRVGYSRFALDGVPIGYGENLAQQMGIPNVNFSAYTSGMSAIVFAGGGMRTLGSGQPIATNLGSLQVLDNVTHIRGRHTWKAGASAIFRSREILNADNINGQFVFNSSLTSNCAGQTAPCRQDAGTGFDVASFLLGYASNRSRSLIGEEPYTETRPEWAAYVQDDFRVELEADPQPRPALGPLRPVGRGRRPAVELRSGDGHVRRRFGRCRDRRGPGGSVPADLVEEGLRAPARLRVRRERQRPDDRPWRLRRLLELGRRRDLVVQGAEPALPAAVRARP